jgi:hypothetical protein
MGGGDGTGGGGWGGLGDDMTQHFLLSVLCRSHSRSNSRHVLHLL